MKYLVFIFLVIVALVSIANLPTLKQSSAHQASAFNATQPLVESWRELAPLSVSALESATKSFDKAFDLKEGSEFNFNGLTVRFENINVAGDCGGGDCRTVTLVFFNEEKTESVDISLGEGVDWGGYHIKLSQIAPLENIGGVPYRAVILVAQNN